MRIRVDFDLCQGHGACKGEAPTVFDVDEREHRVIVLAEEPPESEREAVKRAVKYCPTYALKLEEQAAEGGAQRAAGKRRSEK